MSAAPSALEKVSSEELVALVRVIHEAQQRLRELTDGEVDAVIHPDGRSYLLQEAQEKLRQSETAQRQLAETQVAILNALPAHIALVDLQGVIISMNEAWRLYGAPNAPPGPGLALGQNYLQGCERAGGDGAEDARAAAVGLRRVLRGETSGFTIEYPLQLGNGAALVATDGNAGWRGNSDGRSRDARRRDRTEAGRGSSPLQ